MAENQEKGISRLEGLERICTQKFQEGAIGKGTPYLTRTLNRYQIKDLGYKRLRSGRGKLSAVF